jgi:hypothetical protein
MRYAPIGLEFRSRDKASECKDEKGNEQDMEDLESLQGLF